MKISKKIARTINKTVSGKPSASKPKEATAEPKQTVNDTTKRPGPKKNIAKQIKNHKRQFDYLVIKDGEGTAWFVVSGDVKADKAAKQYLNHYPEADAAEAYREGRCRYNVTTQSYEIIEDEEAPVQGTFAVHMFAIY